MTADTQSRRGTTHTWVAPGAVWLAGAVLSFAAFVTAVVATVKHERWALLWLPLLLFPALLVSLPFWV